jgi:hypothetical protein
MKLPIHGATPETPTVCRLLRTKQSYAGYSDEDATPWQLGASTTAVFWCLQTMGHAGPDDAFVHPNHCQQGRSCFEAELD